MTYKLENYLRTYRKRAGLSQGEVAFLLGCKSGTKVSRYEQFRRCPTLETTLALEVIFRAPVRDLFAGVHHRVAEMTTERAGQLIDKLGSQPLTPLQVQKLATLRAVILHRQ